MSGSEHIPLPASIVVPDPIYETYVSVDGNLNFPPTGVIPAGNSAIAQTEVEDSSVSGSFVTYLRKGQKVSLVSQGYPQTLDFKTYDYADRHMFTGFRISPY